MTSTTTRRVLIGTVAVMVLASPVVVSSPAAAATLTVTTTLDGGAGSLRDAVALASANAEADEIVLAAGATYVLDDCAEGDLDHTATDALTIAGNGAILEQTCDDERVLQTLGDLTVTDLTITGGEATGGVGGGIGADTASVTLTSVTLSENTAITGGGVAAIRATLTGTTVSGNSATSTGGGVWADQTLDVRNSTIADNEAAVSGGGAVVVNDTMTLLFATVVGNSSPTGANVQLQGGADGLVSFASVLAAPTGGADCDLAGGVTVTSQGANVSSDASCGWGAGSDDVIDAGDVGLGALGANGGPTATMLPSLDSVLVDRADCAASPVAIDADQRGVERPQGAGCETGSVEVEAAAPVPPAPDPVPPTAGDARPDASATQPGAPITFTG